MKKNLFIIGFIFSVTVNVAVLVSLGYFWYKGRKVREIRSQEMPRFGGPLERALALSHEQIEAIRALRKDFDPSIADLRMAIRLKRQELMMLLNEPNPDTVQINRKIAEIVSLQEKLEKLTIHHLIKMKRILTPEQMRKLHSLIEKRIMYGGPERRRPPQRPQKFMKREGIFRERR